MQTATIPAADDPKVGAARHRPVAKTSETPSVARAGADRRHIAAGFGSLSGKGA